MALANGCVSHGVRRSWRRNLQVLALRSDGHAEYDFDELEENLACHVAQHCPAQQVHFRVAFWVRGADTLLHVPAGRQSRRHRYNAWTWFHLCRVIDLFWSYCGHCTRRERERFGEPHPLRLQTERRERTPVRPAVAGQRPCLAEGEPSFL